MSIFQNSGKLFKIFLMRGHFIKKERNLMNPKAAWRILLIIFIIVAAVSAFFSFYIFTQIGKKDIFAADRDESITIDSLDRTLLGETIFFYEEKSRNFDELKRNKPLIIDPSI